MRGKHHWACDSVHDRLETQEGNGVKEMKGENGK